MGGIKSHPKLKFCAYKISRNRWQREVGDKGEAGEGEARPMTEGGLAGGGERRLTVGAGGGPVAWIGGGPVAGVGGSPVGDGGHVEEGGVEGGTAGGGGRSDGDGGGRWQSGSPWQPNGCLFQHMATQPLNELRAP